MSHVPLLVGHVLAHAHGHSSSGGSSALLLHISYFQAAVLGLLQGISELFPISSLGHTVLFPTLFGWHSLVKSQSRPESSWLAFVVMLHVGSAIGLLVYFWRDWVQIAGAFVNTVAKRKISTPTERLSWLILIACIPAGVLGLALEHPLRVALAKPLAAAIFLVVNGLILLSAEHLHRRSVERRVAAEQAHKPDGGRELATLDFKEAGVIGLVQSGALIAGLSREGLCMTAGLARGLDYEDSARFAFLLATPIILAAGLFKFSDLTGPLGAGIRGASIVAAACAAVAAIFAIRFLLRWFKTRTLTPFAYYCIAFGTAMAIYIGVTN
jgi:undecaprenyl-diphosphatase